jgi:hypothetical protein
MQVTLTPRGEEILKAYLAGDPGQSPEGLIERALEGLKQEPQQPKRRTPAEAAAHLREARKGVTLGGLKIKDLIEEGRRY